MAYTVIPLEPEEHRSAVRKLWKENVYDPQTNVCAGERFAWLYRGTGMDDVQSWLAVEPEGQAVIGCGSVFRSNRYFRGRVVQAGVPAVFFVQKDHRLAAAGADSTCSSPNQTARPVSSAIASGTSRSAICGIGCESSGATTTCR